MKSLFLTAIFLLPIFSFGQLSSEKSTLTGLVYDDNGAVIANAVIKVRGVDKIENTFKTNDDGVYEIKLNPGNYSIQVESPGFQTFRIDKFRVVSSYKGKQNLDIAMEVAGSSCVGIVFDPTNDARVLNNL